MCFFIFFLSSAQKGEKKIAPPGVFPENPLYVFRYVPDLWNLYQKHSFV